MKPAFLVIFSVIIAIYFLINWYIFSRGLKAIEITSFAALYKWTFWILVVSFPVGQFLERGNPNAVFRIITMIGSFYLVVMLYSVLMVVSIDIIRLFDSWIGFIPQSLKSGLLAPLNIFYVVSLGSLLILILGHLNAISPVVRKYDININKSIGDRNEIKVVLITDIHMGNIIQNNRIEKMVDKINNLEPDLILLAGDLVDHNPKPVIQYKMGEIFLKLKPEFGIFAVTGNHEFIGHADISIDYLSKYGITYIRDTAITIDNKFIIVGRDDKDKPRFENDINRAEMESILENIDSKLPIILMDHQPVEYEKAEKGGVDLMVSGHTHKGQMWPFGYITSAVYKHHYGLMKSGNTNFYTSSGYGTWGPPVRIGTRSEIVEFTLKFE